MINWWSAVIFLAVLVLSAFLGLSPVLLVVLSGVCGLAISSCIRCLNRGKGAAK